MTSCCNLAHLWCIRGRFDKSLYTVSPWIELRHSSRSCCPLFVWFKFKYSQKSLLDVYGMVWKPTALFAYFSKRGARKSGKYLGLVKTTFWNSSKYNSGWFCETTGSQVACGIIASQISFRRSTLCFIFTPSGPKTNFTLQALAHHFLMHGKAVVMDWMNAFRSFAAVWSLAFVLSSWQP